MNALIAIMKKEFLGHKRGFFLVPLILGGLVFIFTALQLLTSNFETLFLIDWVLPIASLEAFNVFYGLAQTIFVPLLFVILSFYFADSFYADTRNHNLLFYKSLPIADSTHTIAKLATGFAILPAIILASTFVLGALFAFLFMFSSQATSVMAVLSAFVIMSLTGAAMLVVMLAWYAPIFALFALLGQLVGRWALPASIGGLITLGLAEKIILFGQSAGVSDILWQRFFLPFDREQFASLIEFHMRAQPRAVLGLLRETLFTTHMVAGIVIAFILFSLATLYRRHWAIK